MEFYKVAQEIRAGRDSWKAVETLDGRRIAYRLTDDGYVADFDATESMEPGRATVWFDATDEGYQAKRRGMEVTNAHGERVEIVSASDYGMPDTVETVTVDAGLDGGAVEMAVSCEDWGRLGE